MTTPEAPVKYKYVSPALASDNVTVLLQRIDYAETDQIVRVCLVGPRGGFRGSSSIDGQELADALAEIGYTAKEAQC